MSDKNRQRAIRSRCLIRACYRISCTLQSSHTMTKSNPFKHKRPPTIWVDESTFCDEQLSPHLASAPNQTMTTASIPSNVVKLQHERPDSGIRQLSQDPWHTFEAIGEIFQDRPLLLARHKRERERIVHIQKLEQGSFPSLTLLELIDKLSHASFLALQECYLHEGMAFLIWEPVEVSVGQILASKCMITASEIIEIVRSASGGSIIYFNPMLIDGRCWKEFSICLIVGESSPP